MLDRYVIGGFYRVHTSRGKDENLNAPGMHFEPLAFDNCCTQPDHANPDATPNRFCTVVRGSRRSRRRSSWKRRRPTRSN